MVREAPPPFGEAEHQVRPTGGAIDLEEHEQASRRQRGTHIGQRASQIGGRVHRIGSQHQVEGSRGQPLLFRRLFDIEELVADERNAEELRFGGGEKRVRDIRKDVVGAIGGKARQRQPSGARSDLEDPERPAFGPGLHHGRNRFRHEQVRSSERHGVLIKMFRGGERSVGKDELEGIHIPSEDRGQPAAAPPDQRKLGERVRELVERLRPPRLGVRGVTRPEERHVPCEDLAMPRRDAQPLRQRRGVFAVSI